MQTWKRWLLFGVSAGFTIVVVGSLALGVAVWRTTREQPWDTSGLFVSSVDEAYQFYEADFSVGGFAFDFGAQNKLSRDLNIAEDTSVMGRRRRDSAF